MPAGSRRFRRFIAPLVVLALAGALQGPARAQTEAITIIRDQFGVPHVYADSLEAVSYGVGYALAQDRLWQMHAFRLIGKGQLSELLGPLIVETDKTVRFFTYTAAERAERFATYPEFVQQGLQAFADGINAYIAEAQTDPTKLPIEFLEFGVPEIPEWTVDDSIALQDVLILAFGSGGGEELQYAALLDQLIDQHGRKQGVRMFNDLIDTEDVDGPITIPRDLRWGGTPTFAREKEIKPTRTLNADARLSLASPAPAPPAHMGLPAPERVGLLDQLSLIPDPQAALDDFEALRRGKEMLSRVFGFGSNAQIVGPKRSDNRNALQTAGPQVGYLVPQWLADIGVHGGGFDAMGMTFAGVGPAVLIGRGPGYAWTTTTGSSDLTDTYVEQLNPDNPREYLWRGRYEPMDCRTETYALHGVPFEEQEICRTRHGPVVSFDEPNGVAYSLRYGWFNRERGTLIGFLDYNRVQSLEDFATAANHLASNHNMFYVDDQGNYGYWHPGYHPRRANGVDLRLPQDGTGSSEWRGLVPLQAVPHAVNFPQSVLVNWNNQPALGWQRERSWEALDNANDLENAVRFGRRLSDPAGGVLNANRKFDFDDLSANLRYAAMKHHRDTYFREFLPDVASLPSDGPARAALGEVVGWVGLRADGDDDGFYDSAGKPILDRWVQVLRGLVFDDDLGTLTGFAGESQLWHVLSQDDRERQLFDWLNGKPADGLIADAFVQAVDQLATEYESQDPQTWQQEVEMEHYQRLNADLFVDTAGTMAGADTSGDAGLPGDVADHIEMDRGTYNHIVAYEGRPSGSGVLGEAAVRAGSVIPPGQCGFVSLLGQECSHFEDQLALYLGWEYKPMPLTQAEAEALAESVVLLEYQS